MPRSPDARKREIEISRGWQDFKRSVMAWMWLFAAIGALRLLYLGITSYYTFIFGDQIHRFYLLVGIITCGVGFFYLRKFSRLAYGIVEIAFAVAWSWAIADHAGEPSPRLDLISMMGILYLVVSGLENCETGHAERRKNLNLPASH